MSYSFVAIDHVQLAAPKGSEEKARNFFVSILGMRELEKPEPLKKRGGLWLEAGTVQIHIGIEEEFIPAKKAHPAILIKNLEALKQQLDQHQIPYQNDQMIPGVTRCYIHDPFGNRIELIAAK